MTETSFASLSPTLLARKGGAKPAMRPQIAPLHGEKPAGAAALAANLEDLGWNDMGEPYDDRPQETGGFAGLTPAPEPVEDADAAHTAFAKPSPAKVQQEELASRISAAAEPSDHHAAEARDDAAPKTEARIASSSQQRRSAISQGKRAAFTLRLDAERHLKLRLASTVKGRSAQQLVTEALDRLLGEMPEIDSMAAQVANK